MEGRLFYSILRIIFGGKMDGEYVSDDMINWFLITGRKKRNRFKPKEGRRRSGDRERERMGSEEKWNRLNDCEPPEKHRLCANGCGFFGSPATLNLCSKCYRDLHAKEEQSSTAMAAVEKSLAAAATTTTSSSSAAAVALAPAEQNLPSSPSQDPISLPPPSHSVIDSSVVKALVSASVASPQQESSAKSRCLSCRKRVGLTGFRCRCGSTFCGAHRYPEEHGCTFDFKATGREAIARANPLVKADKLRQRF